MLGRKKFPERRGGRTYQVSRLGRGWQPPRAAFQPERWQAGADVTAEKGGGWVHSPCEPRGGARGGRSGTGSSGKRRGPGGGEAAEARGRRREAGAVPLQLRQRKEAVWARLRGPPGAASDGSLPTQVSPPRVTAGDSGRDCEKREGVGGALLCRFTAGVLRGGTSRVAPSSPSSPGSGSGRHRANVGRLGLCRWPQGVDRGRVLRAVSGFPPPPPESAATPSAVRLS